jgi:hypothetical protein
LLLNRETQINKKYITHKHASERIKKKPRLKKKNYLPAPGRYVTFGGGTYKVPELKWSFLPATRQNDT